MTKPRLLIIIASTRPGRVGLPVGQWFHERATSHGGFEVEVADLAEWNLPFMDEPNHPRLRQYTQPHTQRWSATVDCADGFVFVMPEYNNGFNAPLKNAIDYLYQEWQYKPVGFVSYGGTSGGLRAVQMAKLVVTVLRMVPVVEAVTIPFVAQSVVDGQLQPNATLERASQSLLDELQRLELALRTLRTPAVQKTA
jgi:NAD(P)H-dependent FMN reductase